MTDGATLEPSAEKPHCSLSGNAYNTGSPGDFVHQFIQASDVAAQREALARMFSAPIFLGGTIEEIEGHSIADLHVSDSDDERARIETRYYLLGNTFVQNGHPLEGLAVLRGLYPLMRRMEILSGRRWHKGSALFFLAQALLGVGSPLEAQQAFILALVEDALSECAGGPAVKTLPAYAHLIKRLGLAEHRVSQLTEAVLQETRRADGWTPSEPERSYLFTVCDQRFWSRALGTIPFTHEVARHFVDLASVKVGTAYARGRALELIVAYLLEAAGGFRVVMRARGLDAENDLVVWNLHNDRPLSVLGDYFVVSCKNTVDRVDAQIIREFRARIQEYKCNCGIIVSRRGITGDSVEGAARAADRAVMKTEQPILVLDIDDLRAMCLGRDELPTLLIEKYAGRLMDLF